MTTMDVQDATGQTVAVEKPLAPGRAAAASSRPVALSTEDLAALAALATSAKQDAAAALLGAVTETAPATDTASSGLNGRLQRVAQRLTSLLALLPAALGAGGGLKVDGSGTALPVSAASLPLPTGAATEATLASAATAANQSAQSTLIGAVTETAPATDTASSGLNGRLQRIAQRLTSLLALLPAALGTGGGLKVDGSGTALPVSAASLPLPTGAATEATLASAATAANQSAQSTLIGAVTETAPATDTASSGLNGRLQRVAQRVTALIALLPASLGQTTKSASLSVTVASDQNGLSNRAISAAFTTLTRPANATPYTAGDAISDNATAGSVTALSATLSDVNDDPLFLSEVLIASTDTGLAGKRIRAYLFNADPTASSGVGGGDNAAYSQKKAGYIGSFSGVLESGFSDGTVGRLVPSFADGASSGAHASANGFLVTKPTSGAKTLFIQFQAVDAFTPSANSTTIIASARGWQARAA